MNKNTTQKIVPIPGFVITAGARAMLVTQASGGEFKVQPVPPNASVLDLETELTAHLDAMPVSQEWLIDLQRYVSQRLLARDVAAKAGGVSIARGDGWNIVRTG